MRIYKEIQKNDKVLDSAICDKCGKTCNSKNQILDFQEWFYYRFTGGYSSIFGDGEEYEIDLCQQCTKKLLGPYLKNINSYIPATNIPMK